MRKFILFFGLVVMVGVSLLTILNVSAAGDPPGKGKETPVDTATDVPKETGTPVPEDTPTPAPTNTPTPHAKEPTNFLLIDEDSIDNGTTAIEDISFNAPFCGAGDPAVCVNDDIAADAGSGLTTALFSRGVDITPYSGLVLPTGQVGDEGLFFVGLSSADLAAFVADTLPNKVLDPIPGVPLSAADINGLVGQTFCAKVADSDVSNLTHGQLNAQGAYMGLTAFTVTATSPNPAGGSYLPLITVDLLPSASVHAFCQTARPAKPAPPSFDSDLDGCTNGHEDDVDEEHGGERDSTNPYDFYDTNDDRTIDLFIDIFAVADGFGDDADNIGSNEPDGYDADLDRSAPLPGDDPWDMQEPDGTIDLFVDIFGVAGQFGHSCN